MAGDLAAWRGRARFAQLAVLGGEVRQVLYREGGYLVLRAEPPLPRLGESWPALYWAELEAERWYGLAFSAQEGQGRDLLDSNPQLFAFPYGPVRETQSEAIFHRIVSGGERIAAVELRPFLKRRGVERRLGEIPLAWLPRVAERLAALSSVADSLAVARAAEAATGAVPPPRAELWRVVFAELERLYNHLDYFARQAATATLRVGEAQAATLKEGVQRLAEQLSASRFLRGLVAVGGLVAEPPLPSGSWLAELDALQRRAAAYLDRLLATELFVDRLERSGAVSRQGALDFCLVGPSARASGLGQDLRVDPGYGAYPELGLGVPIHEEGDALARCRVRAEELRISFDLIQRAVSALRRVGGPVHNPPGPLPPGSEALGYAEGPRGETLAYLRCDASGQPHWALRPASQLLWPAFAQGMRMSSSQMDYIINQVSFHPLQAAWDR
jgi:Ni,Fe-hydrogenase III large subunit